MWWCCRNRWAFSITSCCPSAFVYWVFLFPCLSDLKKSTTYLMAHVSNISTCYAGIEHVFWCFRFQWKFWWKNGRFNEGGYLHLKSSIMRTQGTKEQRMAVMDTPRESMKKVMEVKGMTRDVITLVYVSISGSGLTLVSGWVWCMSTQLYQRVVAQAKGCS